MLKDFKDIDNPTDRTYLSWFIFNVSVVPSKRMILNKLNADDILLMNAATDTNFINFEY